MFDLGLGAGSRCRRVISPWPPGIAELMLGAEMTVPSRTIAKKLPTLFVVYVPNFAAASLESSKSTTGWPFWSMAAVADVIDEPSKSGTRLGSAGNGCVLGHARRTAGIRGRGAVRRHRQGDELDQAGRG